LLEQQAYYSQHSVPVTAHSFAYTVHKQNLIECVALISTIIVKKGLSGFPGCRPTDLEWPAGRRDICRVVIHISSATQSASFHKILFL